MSSMPKKATKTQENNEFAVIATGGKQYKVSAGDSVKIEKIKGEFKEGDKVTFDKVLLVDDGANTTIGTPYIDGAKVEGTLLKLGRYPKVIGMRYKQKSRTGGTRFGHRQPYFEVKIEKIK